MAIREATLDDSESISSLVYWLSAKYIAHEFTLDGAETLLSSMKPDVIKKYIQSGFRYHVTEIDGPTTTSNTASTACRMQGGAQRDNAKLRQDWGCNRLVRDNGWVSSLKVRFLFFLYLLYLLVEFVLAIGAGWVWEHVNRYG